MKDYESGYWTISEATAKRLVGGKIHLHDKQKLPSRFGGIIKSYRVQPDGVYQGKIIFRFSPTKEQKGVIAPDNWNWEKQVGEDYVHLIHKTGDSPGLLQRVEE